MAFGIDSIRIETYKGKRYIMTGADFQTMLRAVKGFFPRKFISSDDAILGVAYWLITTEAIDKLREQGYQFREW